MVRNSIIEEAMSSKIAHITVKKEKTQDLFGKTCKVETLQHKTYPFSTGFSLLIGETRRIRSHAASVENKTKHLRNIYKNRDRT